MARGGQLASLSVALLLVACGGGHSDDAHDRPQPIVLPEKAHPDHATGHAPHPNGDTPPQAPVVHHPPNAPPAFLGGAETDDAWMARVRELSLLKLKPIGTTSVVFRATLAGDVDVAFRPRTRQSPRGAMAEVAAYRIARALGMDQVPPAFLRTFQRTEMRPRIDSDYRAAWGEFEDAFIGDGDGGVPGSFVKWVPGLQDVGLDQQRHVEEWERWITAGAALPEEHREVARDMSELVMFDFLIGNFDRWSGGNIAVDATGRRVVVRDHNLSFLEPLPAPQADRVRGTMQRADRLSRRFVSGLRALDEAHLRAVLAEDPGAEALPLLTDGQIAAVLERRATLLSRVAALIDANGMAETLYFE